MLLSPLDHRGALLQLGLALCEVLNALLLILGQFAAFLEDGDHRLGLGSLGSQSLDFLCSGRCFSARLGQLPVHLRLVRSELVLWLFLRRLLLLLLSVRNLCIVCHGNLA